MREIRGPDARDIWATSEVLERKLSNAERRIAALTQELALKSEQLSLTKRQMMDAQQRRIDEERLKVVLQMAGATAAELDEPLSDLLRASADLEVTEGCTGEVCARLAELKECAARVEQIVSRIQHAQAHILTPACLEPRGLALHGVYHVLLIEHEERFATSLHTWLEPWSEMVHLERVTNCAQAETRFETDHYDLILSDYQLPDGTSLDLFTRLSERMALPPFILISGYGSEDIVAQAVRRGAYDFLPKAGLSRDRVVQSILAALERVRLKQDLEAAHKHLAELATHDELTGLYNRRYLSDALDTEISRARRYGQPLTLCLFDLDHFKRMNDRFGHDAGDTVLVSVAEILHQTVRSPDVAGRYGGEEFLVLLINTDLEKAGHFGGRLLEQVERRRFRFMDEEAVRITCSAGLAEFQRGEDAASLVHRADKAMYQAKEAGRNRVCSAV